MTESQPWPTTVQRRRGSGDETASEVATPRHGHPAEGPVATRVPSPVPRQRDTDASPDAAQAYPQLPRPNPQVTREPSPPARQDAGQPRPTHVRDLVQPGPSQARSAPALVTTVVARDSGAMTALRVVTYVLVSLASLVFLAFVVYGGVKYMQLRDAFSTSPFGSLTSSSSSDTGVPAICVTDPANPACAYY
ncbi:hypothetical protein [Pseudonocardia sp. KRD291]|uniref:hypothetical protein n=1 Tax=Pseudonocardia sp. KRD291 TaxID=2792007 RepID=UPI001C49EB5E|nr:hypothetical protein [Pseudonocardia sp. KRD291]MBW0105144.1 hypothetical protein [Pseudonocardia sp. KRD291]